MENYWCQTQCPLADFRSLYKESQTILKDTAELLVSFSFACFAFLLDCTGMKIYQKSFSQDFLLNRADKKNLGKNVMLMRVSLLLPAFVIFKQ